MEYIQIVFYVYMALGLLVSIYVFWRADLRERFPVLTAAIFIAAMCVAGVNISLIRVMWGDDFIVRKPVCEHVQNVQGGE